MQSVSAAELMRLAALSRECSKGSLRYQENDEQMFFSRVDMNGIILETPTPFQMEVIDEGGVRYHPFL